MVVATAASTAVGNRGERHETTRVVEGGNKMGRGVPMRGLVMEQTPTNRLYNAKLTHVIADRHHSWQRKQLADVLGEWVDPWAKPWA